MARGYRHIEGYEKEIISMWEKGNTLRKIGEQLGFTYKQLRDLNTRYNKKQRKVASGMFLKKKDRAAKDSMVTKKDKFSDLRYKLAHKDARIKQLEMENELTRDFLSFTERK